MGYLANPHPQSTCSILANTGLKVKQKTRLCLLLTTSKKSTAQPVEPLQTTQLFVNIDNQN